MNDPMASRHHRPQRVLVWVQNRRGQPKSRHGAHELSGIVEVRVAEESSHRFLNYDVDIFPAVKGEIRQIAARLAAALCTNERNLREVLQESPRCLPPAGRRSSS
jgi:hypothetical protein